MSIFLLSQHRGSIIIECTRKGMVSLAKVQRMLVFNRLGHTINAIRHTKWMWRSKFWSGEL